jgi:calcium-dependent protein kinase
MLTGCPPFFAKDKNEIFKSIVNKDPGFGNMQNKLSEDAVDLVKAMLNKSPSERITMQEVLNHPWLNSNVRSEVLDLDRAEDITKNLTIFHK